MVVVANNNRPQKRAYVLIFEGGRWQPFVTLPPPKMLMAGGEIWPVGSRKQIGRDTSQYSRETHTLLGGWVKHTQSPHLALSPILVVVGREMWKQSKTSLHAHF
jgi:hypothetical protein